MLCLGSGCERYPVTPVDVAHLIPNSDEGLADCRKVLRPADDRIPEFDCGKFGMAQSFFDQLGSGFDAALVHARGEPVQARGLLVRNSTLIVIQPNVTADSRG